MFGVAKSKLISYLIFHHTHFTIYQHKNTNYSIHYHSLPKIPSPISSSSVASMHHQHQNRTIHHGINQKLFFPARESISNSHVVYPQQRAIKIFWQGKSNIFLASFSWFRISNVQNKHIDYRYKYREFSCMVNEILWEIINDILFFV